MTFTGTAGTTGSTSATFSWSFWQYYIQPNQPNDTAYTSQSTFKIGTSTQYSLWGKNKTFSGTTSGHTHTFTPAGTISGGSHTHTVTAAGNIENTGQDASN